MKKVDIRNILYSKEKSPLEFNFDNLTAPSMFNFITLDDINYLHNIASSIRLSSKINQKYEMIHQLMTVRGFRKVAAGTNRVVYRHYEYPDCVLKIAIDRVGLSDNPKEFKNQHLLKPFVTKMFECSPCGTVAWCEYSYPITNREEFLSIAEDVFNLITSKIVGKYVLEDIGTKYFMNWSNRVNFGPILLDYPYVYELDGAKLYCNRNIPEMGIICDGMIDYDDGFNTLICTKCGKKYLAKDLEDNSSNNKIRIEKDEEDLQMKVIIKKGDEVIYRSGAQSSVITNTDDTISVIASKMKVVVKDRKIPKKMKTVDLEKEQLNKSKEALKKSAKIAKNLQDHFNAKNDGRFIEPDYSKYELKDQDSNTDNNTIPVQEIDYEKEFGLKPINERETLKRSTQPNPYIDRM